SAADDQIYATLQAILDNNPDLYGACFAFAPDALGPGRDRFAPYMCRDGGSLRSMDLSTAYDYTLPEWEWFARPYAEGEAWWTEPYFDEGAGNAAMITYSMPVRSGDRIIAIQTIDIRLEDLQRRLLIPSSLPGARWLILSRTGAFLSVQDPSLLLHTTIFDLAQRQGQPGLAQIGSRMVEGKRGRGAFHDADGSRRLVSFEPIPSTGWSFAMHVSERSVLDPVYAGLRQRMAGAALVSLVLLGVVLAAAFWIARPIPRLAAAVRELSGGNLEARVRGVHSRDEFGELASGFNRMVEQLGEHVERLTSETAARERVESELRVAREIQVSLLPSTFPAFPERTEFDLFASNAAARSIAGDFFDFEMTGPDRLYFVMADVSGKGVPAAMFMAVTRTLLRNVNGRESPAEMLRAVNDVLVPENRRMMFVTLLLGLYDIRTGTIRFANAGHPPGRILGPDGALRTLGREEDGGALLGVIAGESWQDQEGRLAPGETLVLYTDGVTEAGMGERQLYGQDRMDELLRASPGLSSEELVRQLAEDVDRYTSGSLTDDVTLMALRRVT
ncbi:MAG: SpoIIE family protein phosphatase, partial [Phycisphaerales bacterium JB039]